MLRNNIFSINRGIKLHSENLINFNGFKKGICVKGNLNFFNKNPTLRLIAKYGFFRNEKIIDYKKNYYEILQVKENASLIQIKKSFYKLAKESHPDTSEGNQDLFKSINEAYNVLSHQDRRKLYDVNRQRKQGENSNDAKAQAQSKTSSTHEQRESMSQENKNSEQYTQQHFEPYYHFNQSQWQQFRSGYKYHISPEYEYYMNITNNVSSQKLYQNMKRNYEKRTKKDEQFFKEMEQYYEYLEKVKQKKQQNIEEYHTKIAQMNQKLKQERRKLFQKSFICKGYDRVKSMFQKIGQIFSKQSKQKK